LNNFCYLPLTSSISDNRRPKLKYNIKNHHWTRSYASLMFIICRSQILAAWIGLPHNNSYVPQHEENQVQMSWCCNACSQRCRINSGW